MNSKLIFIRALHASMGAPRRMIIPSDGGEGAGDSGRQAPGVGSNSKSVALNPTPEPQAAPPPPGEGIFRGVPHDLFKLTPAGENVL